MRHVDQFETHRNSLFGIAYRILGSAMEAEDVLQEAFLRWQGVPLEKVDSPKAYLATMVTRLSIDALRAAQARRENYLGPWLPEPLDTTGRADLTETAIQRETLSIALLHLMERLSPEQRAAFVLREAFDYDYSEIADVLDTSPQNSRQLVSRARHILEHQKPRPIRDPRADSVVIRQMMECLVAGNTSCLETLLAEDVVHYSDGNGMQGIARRPIVGRQNVSRFFIGLQRHIPFDPENDFLELNAGPAVLLRWEGRPYAVFTFHIQEGRVQETFAVVNPDKLGASGIGDTAKPV